MVLNVFISHSMSPEDLGTVYEISKQAKLSGIQTYIAERDPQYGKPLSEKIDRAIRACDCMIVFLTRGGARSPWVSQEIGVARTLGKLRIPIVEEGVQLRGFDVGNEYIRFERRETQQTVKNVIEYLNELKMEKEQREALGWIILGGLALLGLGAAALALSKEKE